jgi:hypothetical protein
MTSERDSSSKKSPKRQKLPKFGRMSRNETDCAADARLDTPMPLASDLDSIRGNRILRAFHWQSAHMDPLPTAQTMFVHSDFAAIQRPQLRVSRRSDLSRRMQSKGRHINVVKVHFSDPTARCQ